MSRRPALLLHHPSGDVQPLEDLDDEAAVDDHGDDDDGEGGAEDHLPTVGDRVPDGQRKGDGSSQSGEHHHVLEVGGDLDTSLEVEEGGQGVHIEGAPQEDSCEGGCDVYRLKVMLGECEHGDSNVGEDKVLR